MKRSTASGWRTLVWAGVPMVGYLSARVSGLLDVGVAVLPAVAAVWLANVAFVVFMHTIVPWRSNAWGQHVLMFSWALILVIGLSLARLVFGDYPYRADVLDIAYCVLAGAMLQRPWLVVREHFGWSRNARRARSRYTGTRDARLSDDEGTTQEIRQW